MAKTDLRCLKDGEYFKIYSRIFAFHKKHINAGAEADWFDCAAELEQFETPFERALVVAVLDELDRDYEKKESGKQLVL